MLLSQGTKINSLYNNYDLNENSANSLNWVRLNNSILAKPNIALIHIPTPKEILVNKLNENTQNYIKTIIYNFKDGKNGTYCK